MHGPKTQTGGETKPEGKEHGERENPRARRERGVTRGNASKPPRANRRSKARTRTEGRSRGSRARPQKRAAEARRPEPDHRNRPRQEQKTRSPSPNKPNGEPPRITETSQAAPKHRRPRRGHPGKRSSRRSRATSAQAAKRRATTPLQAAAQPREAGRPGPAGSGWRSRA